MWVKLLTHRTRCWVVVLLWMQVTFIPSFFMAAAVDSTSYIPSCNHYTMHFQALVHLEAMGTIPEGINAFRHWCTITHNQEEIEHVLLVSIFRDSCGVVDICRASKQLKPLTHRTRCWVIVVVVIIFIRNPGLCQAARPFIVWMSIKFMIVARTTHARHPNSLMLRCGLR